MVVAEASLLVSAAAFTTLVRGVLVALALAISIPLITPVSDGPFRTVGETAATTVLPWK